jgi:peptidoglycan/xylan/chitin deacetylase (PgdA/CDA1 family)
MMVKPPRMLRRVYADALWKVQTKEKKLYLTFDDGPIPEVTPWVLEQLKTYNAKATFFCIGNNIAQYPQVFQAIVDQEHSVGNHTFDHLNGWTTQKEIYLQNIEQCQSYFTQTINRKLFRPPYGKMKFSQYNALKRKYKVVLWDVLSMDYDTTISADQVLNNVIQHAESGSIIVFHDSLKAESHLLYVLPKVLQYFSEKGFTFATLCD